MPTVKPDAIIYNSLINSCAKMNRMKQALHIYEDMRAQGIPTDQRTLSAVMNVFSRMGDIGTHIRDRGIGGRSQRMTCLCFSTCVQTA